MSTYELTARDLQSVAKPKSKGTTTRPEQTKPSRRLKTAAVLGSAAVLAVAAAIPSIIKSNRHDEVEALVNQPRVTVLEEINQGKLSPKEVTEVTVQKTANAYNVTTAFEGESVDHTRGDNSIIAQTPGASSLDTRIPAGTKIILPLSDVQGHPVSALEQARQSEQASK